MFRFARTHETGEPYFSCSIKSTFFFLLSTIIYQNQDIANHQLQFLREYLFRTSVDWELGALYDRQLRGVVSLDSTRRWISLHFARSFSSRSPSEPKSITIDRALCEGIVDLIFYPPHNTLAAQDSFAEQVFLPTGSHVPQYPLHHHQQPQHAPSIPPPGYPESLWLDHTRLSVLSTDIADLIAIYMTLMLFRQTVYSSDSRVQVQDWELVRLKQEIWQVGPQRPGWCFFRGGFGALPITNMNTNHTVTTATGKNKEEEDILWRRGMKDIVLQLAARARETLAGINGGSIPEPERSPTRTPAHAQHHYHHHHQLPDPEHVQLLERWIFSNMTMSSTIHDMFRKKLRGVLLDIVYKAVLPISSSSSSTITTTTATTTTNSPWTSTHTTTVVPDIPPGMGLEPLLPEIQLMGSRITKLVSLHSHVYRHVYATSGFILDPS